MSERVVSGAEPTTYGVRRLASAQRRRDRRVRRSLRWVTVVAGSDLDAFLAEQRNLIVAGTRADGRPHVTPTWFYWDGERFYVSTHGAGLSTRSSPGTPGLSWFSMTQLDCAPWSSAPPSRSGRTPRPSCTGIGPYGKSMAWTSWATRSTLSRLLAKGAPS